MVNAPVFSTGASQPPTIAIVGGSFSGVAAAIALLAKLKAPLRLRIVEPGSVLGVGVAYGTARQDDLLNVRAQDMRLRADLPHDFLTWLAGEDLLGDDPFQSPYYAPRQVFGAFINARLAAAIAGRPDVDVCHLKQSAREIGEGDGRRYSVVLDNGDSIAADIVIAATGYGRQEAARFGFGAFEKIPASVLRNARTAVIVGSGLSAIDAALHLTATSPRIRVRLISRHGLRPLVQATGAAASSTAWSDPLPTTAREALAVIKRRIHDAAAEGNDWRAVLNRLRPVTQAIWMGFAPIEKKRFARVLKSYWDANRHRTPASTALKVAELEITAAPEISAQAWRAAGEIERLLRPDLKACTVRADYLARQQALASYESVAYQNGSLSGEPSL